MRWRSNVFAYPIGGVWRTLERHMSWSIFFVLVAEEAEEICGYCIVYAVMDSADIGKIAVAPKARGKGIAGNLLEHLWKVCAERGIKDVILEVRASMMLRGACIQSMDSRRFPCGRIIIKSLWNMD